MYAVLMQCMGARLVQVELHGAWFLEVAQHQLVCLAFKLLQ